MGAVEWLVELTVAEGNALAARALLNEMAAANAAEPGTETWNWYMTENSSHVVILERYRDEDAAMAHLQNFGHFVERFLAVMTPIGFRVLAAPSSIVREAVTGFGPVYFAPGGGFRR